MHFTDIVSLLEYYVWVSLLLAAVLPGHLVAANAKLRFFGPKFGVEVVLEVVHSHLII